VLENELREAMVAETASLRVAPDLVERVVRGSRRRRSARVVTGLVAAAVAVIAGLVAASGHFGETDRVAVGPPSALAAVDGVEVRYVPDGLGEPRLEDVPNDRLKENRATWGEGHNLVRVTVYREKESQYGLINPDDPQKAGLPGGQPVTVRGRTGARLTSGGDSELIWIEKSSVALRVTVGAKYRDKLSRIAQTLWGADPTGPVGGAFEGVRVPYLPSGVFLEGVITSASTDWGYTSKLWRGDGRWVRLMAVRGSEATTLPNLVKWAKGTPEPAESGNHVTIRGKDAHQVTATRASPAGAEQAPGLMWVEKPGLGYVLSASRNLDSSLMTIANAMVPVDAPALDGALVDGVALGHLPRGVEAGSPAFTAQRGPTFTAYKGWVTTTRRWSGGPATTLEVTVARGAVLHMKSWSDAFLDGRKGKEVSLGGSTGTLLEDARERQFVLNRDNVAVSVKVSADLADQLDMIVRQLIIPDPS
jgi:hypothetical protein